MRKSRPTLHSQTRKSKQVSKWDKLLHMLEAGYRGPKVEKTQLKKEKSLKTIRKLKEVTILSKKARKKDNSHKKITVRLKKNSLTVVRNKRRTKLMKRMQLE